MNNLKIILISLSLSMDAFSASVCKCLNIKNNFKLTSLIISFSFSIFQMIMPLIGYFLGNTLSNTKVCLYNSDNI